MFEIVEISKVYCIEYRYSMESTLVGRACFPRDINLATVEAAAGSGAQFKKAMAGGIL
jgi:hypothetical protein